MVQENKAIDKVVYQVIGKVFKYIIYFIILYFAFEGFMAWK